MTGSYNIFSKFLGQDIFLEQGRLLFSLFHAFSSSGYRISFYKHLLSEELLECADEALSLDGVTQTDQVPGDTHNYIYLFDEEDKSLAKRIWWKKIAVNFDVFSPYWFEPPIIMPFPVHPVHAMRGFENRLDDLRAIKKDKRIFFSGDVKCYNRCRVRYPKPKLPRLEIVNTIIDRMGKDVLLIADLSELSQLNAAGYTNKCVLVDTTKTWVDDKVWPDMLATADFFLAPPGIVMPMCHNIVEAMAVGCVPITNYPEWFDPALTPGENCIVFDDQDSLLDKLHMILKMPKEIIAEMRVKVLDYYEQYLRPATFIRRVEESSRERITVLLITEKNMARHPNKLSKRSVLIKGTASNGQKSGLGRAMSLLLG